MGKAEMPQAPIMGFTFPLRMRFNSLAKITPPAVSKRKATKNGQDQPTPDPKPLLKQAFDIAVQDEGWAFLGTLGHHLRQLDPSFDARSYGHSQLSTLIRSNSKLFEVKEVKTPEGNSVIYVRWIE